MPKSPKTCLFFSSHKANVLTWMQARIRNDARVPRVLVIEGPNGCGKATYVRLLAAELGMDVREVLDLATFGDWLDCVRKHVGTARFGSESKSLWLFRNVDGLFTPPKMPPKAGKPVNPNPVEELIQLWSQASASYPPIVCTVNSWDPKPLHALRTASCVHRITAYAIPKPDAEAVLANIAFHEHVSDATQHKAIGAFCGDLRLAITNLQMDGSTSRRDTSMNVFDTVRTVLSPDARTPNELIKLCETHSLFDHVLYSNYPYGLGTPVTDLTMSALADCADAMSYGARYGAEWSGGRPQDELVVQAVALARMMAVRGARARVHAKHLGGQLQFQQLLKQQPMMDALKAARRGLTTTSQCTLLNMTERLACIRHFNTKGFKLLPVSVDEPVSVEFSRPRESVSDAFYHAFGVTRTAVDTYERLMGAVKAPQPCRCKTSGRDAYECQHLTTLEGRPFRCCFDASVRRATAARAVPAALGVMAESCHLAPSVPLPDVSAFDAW